VVLAFVFQTLSGIFHRLRWNSCVPGPMDSSCGRVAMLTSIDIHGRLSVSSGKAASMCAVLPWLVNQSALPSGVRLSSVKLAFFLRRDCNRRLRCKTCGHRLTHSHRYQYYEIIKSTHAALDSPTKSDHGSGPGAPPGWCTINA